MIFNFERRKTSGLAAASAATAEPQADAFVTPLLPHFQDPLVDEVLVNGTVSLAVVADNRVTTTASPYRDNWQMIAALQDFALARQVRLDPLCPAGGGTFEGHRYRWHALLPPLSPEGALFALRRHRFDCLSLADFGADPELVAQLRQAFRARANLLIAGPTGSGKSSLLACLLQAEAMDERVVLVEALQELPLASRAWVRLLERRPNLEGLGAISLLRLLQEALRLRPDRLVVGEIRSNEAQAFVEAAMTGHGGLLATIHAGSAAEALRRLERLAAGGPGRFPVLPAEVLESIGVVLMERGRPPRLVGLEALRPMA